VRYDLFALTLYIEQFSKVYGTEQSIEFFSSLIPQSAGLILGTLGILAHLS